MSWLDNVSGDTYSQTAHSDDNTVHAFPLQERSHALAGS